MWKSPRQSVPTIIQLWKDVDKVVMRSPTHGGELQIHLDTCSGDTIAVMVRLPTQLIHKASLN